MIMFMATDTVSAYASASQGSVFFLQSLQCT